MDARGYYRGGMKERATSELIPIGTRVLVDFVGEGVVGSAIPHATHGYVYVTEHRAPNGNATREHRTVARNVHPLGRETT